MKVNVTTYSRNIVFDFSLDDKDQLLLDEKVHIAHRSCFFELPFEPDVESIHPDLLALSIILCTYPFVSEKYEFPFYVSTAFAEAFEATCRKKIINVDSSIEPRFIKDGRPGLAFSGGIDSAAAMALLPDNAASIFIDRIKPYGVKSIYKKDAAHKSVSDVSDAGREVYSVKTNFEHLRSVVGFPVDLSVAIPVLLSADHLNIDSFSCGMTLDGNYRVGHEKYQDYTKRVHFTRWGKLFELVGCEFFLATAGLSELANAKVSNDFAISNNISGCMRGDLDKPCNKCMKCFRKSLINSAITDGEIDFSDLIYNLNSREVILNMSKKDLKLENTYRYICSNIKPNPLINALKDKVVISEENTSWMDRWYPKSIELIPAKYRDDFMGRLGRYLEVMTDEDVAFVESWDVDNYTYNTDEQHAEWLSTINKYIDDERLKALLV